MKTAKELVARLYDCDVSKDTYSEIIAAALEINWDAAYEATREDNEPTDASAEVGDVIAALYHHAEEWHGGQWSDLYRLLCSLGTVYSPGYGGLDLDSWASSIHAALGEAARI